MIIIGEYYPMTTMDENVNRMKPTHVLAIFPLDLRAPFCKSTFTSMH